MEYAGYQFGNRGDSDISGILPEREFFVDCSTAQANIDIMLYYVGKADGQNQNMTLTAEGWNSTYDGEHHSVTITSTMPEGTTIEYKVGDGEWTTEAPSITDVGTQTVNIRATKDGFNEATAEVTLRVTPAILTVTTESASKFYDTTALTANGNIRGLQAGETVTFNVTGTQTV